MEQPEKILKVANMALSNGISHTLDKISGKFDPGSPTGYSAAGVVIEAGKGVKDIQPGDRVAVAGAGIANHAEYVEVPLNLVVPVPKDLSFSLAATVTMGGIALQGVRRAKPQIGEYVVVLGTGVLGLIALQLLNASGVRVIAVDLSGKRLHLAQQLGAELCINPKEVDPVKTINHHTGGHGADIVLFTASSNDPEVLSTAFAMTRKKGKLIMVGIWGQILRREDIYAKELDFLISTSYGPGRYDSTYEDRGLDYPYAYVRWTENRNLTEYLRLVAEGRIQIDPLIQATYPVDKVESAFELLRGEDRPLIILLDYGRGVAEEYSNLVKQKRRIENRLSYRPVGKRRIRVGVIGAGRFATGVHLPNLRKQKDAFEIRAICTNTGHKGLAVAQEYGAQYTTTNYKEILSDQEIDLVLICTPPNLHGQMVLDSLKAGKHTFVEKPLCTKREELEKIETFFFKVSGERRRRQPLLLPGFNRRFSKYAQEVKKHTASRMNPLFLHYRMNAGYLPADHWVYSEDGGGRIIGESCHIIDLFSFLVESPVRSLSVSSLRPKTDSISMSDNKAIVFEYEDGSVATLQYFAIGSSKFSKEYFEIHFDEKTIVVDDFRSIHGFGLNVADLRTSKSEKGHSAEIKALAHFLSGDRDEMPIPVHNFLETTELTFEIASI